MFKVFDHPFQAQTAVVVLAEELAAEVLAADDQLQVLDYTEGLLSITTEVRVFVCCAINTIYLFR
jgi:hypothetical protein